MFSSDPALVSNQLPISLDFPSEPQELNLFVQAIIKRIANSMNSKESGLYIPLESSTFISYFTPNNSQKFRNVYRKVIDFGALPNSSLKSVAHGINFTSEFTMTRMYATATDPNIRVYIPIPYASPTAIDSIGIYSDSTNVNIFTGTARSNFTRCYVVLEYVKNP